MKTLRGKLTRSLGLLALAGGLGFALTALDSQPAEAELELFLGPDFPCGFVCPDDPTHGEECCADPLKPIIVVVDGGG